MITEIPAPNPKVPEPTITDLDIGPQLFVDGTDLSFTFEFVPERGDWTPGNTDLESAYAGGAWSVDIPGNADFPAAVFTDILAGPVDNSAEVNIVTNVDRLPTSFVWIPQDESRVLEVVTILAGPDGVFPLCLMTLVDDGEFAIPPECIGEGDTPPPPLGFDSLIVAFNHRFLADVAYAGYRLRIQQTNAVQLIMQYPFEFKS